MATFVVAGAGAIGAGAALNFNGSDTLGDFTAELITNHNIANTAVITGAPFCQFVNDGGTVFSNDAGSDPFVQAHNGSLVYLGGGSGTGENNMAAGKQGLAPMSKFLTSASCVGTLTVEGTTTTDGGAATLAHGLVVALDGLSIVGANVTAGQGACNGDASDLACLGEKAFGLAADTSISYPLPGGGTGTYTFLVWQDVLKALYFGTLNATAPANVKALG
jgi:hypothetical protein